MWLLNPYSKRVSQALVSTNLSLLSKATRAGGRQNKEKRTIFPVQMQSLETYSSRHLAFPARPCWYIRVDSKDVL